MLKKCFILSFLVASFFFSAYADSSTMLSQTLKNMHSAQANFSQTIVDKKGRILEKSSGHMALQRPGQFRWDTQQPAKQLIVTNGKRLWVYDPELEQVTIRKLAKAAGEAPAMLLSDDDLALEKEFTVEMATGTSPSVQWFLLKPKDKSSIVSELRLGFVNQIINEMEIHDHLGHVTRIHFKNVVFNLPVPSSLFTFKIPAHVDVIDETK